MWENSFAMTMLSGVDTTWPNGRGFVPCVIKVVTSSEVQERISLIATRISDFVSVSIFGSQATSISLLVRCASTANPC